MGEKEWSTVKSPLLLILVLNHAKVLWLVGMRQYHSQWVFQE